MRIDRENLVLRPISGWDELRFFHNTAVLLGSLAAVIADETAARAVAENCVLIYCATKGQIPEVTHPGELLYQLDLSDLAALAEEYHRLFDGAEEGGCNESFPGK